MHGSSRVACRMRHRRQSEVSDGAKVVPCLTMGLAMESDGRCPETAVLVCGGRQTAFLRRLPISRVSGPENGGLLARPSGRQTATNVSVTVTLGRQPISHGPSRRVRSVLRLVWCSAVTVSEQRRVVGRVGVSGSRSTTTPIASPVSYRGPSHCPVRSVSPRLSSLGQVTRRVVGRFRTTTGQKACAGLLPAV